jgi:hypothetical protein
MTACLFVDHSVIVPGRRVTLFMGKVTLERVWPKIVQWIGKSTSLQCKEMQQIELSITQVFTHGSAPESAGFPASRLRR